MSTAVGPFEFKKGGLVELLTKSPFLFSINRFCNVQLLREIDLRQIMYKIVKNRNIEGTFNMVPDSFCSPNELLPGKVFINISLWVIKLLSSILWALRISNMHPDSISISAYPIIADPGKIMKKLKYRFKYKIIPAFKGAFNGMKKNGFI